MSKPLLKSVSLTFHSLFSLSPVGFAICSKKTKALYPFTPAVSSAGKALKNTKTKKYVKHVANEFCLYLCLGRSNGHSMLGRIVVHDRALVEAEVLPRYFNHASFASLRRQLNYFSFTRVGKGRQRGATYCNEGVIELDDILHLKRRPAGTTAFSADQHDVVTYPDEPSVNGQDTDEAVTQIDSQHLSSASTFDNLVVPFVHLSPTKKRKKEPLGLRHEAQKRRFFKQASVVSPMSSSPSSEDEQCPHQQIILDLTVPCTLRDDRFDAGWKTNRAVSCSADPMDALPRDEDILSGSQALLSFSHGASRLGFSHV
jgi:hypothetical protein